MSDTPVPRDPGRDEDPSGVPAGPGDRPSLGSPGWQLVPQSPDWDEAQLAVLLAEAREIIADRARAAEAAARWGQTGLLGALGAMVTGRRGPGMPGSEQTFPGEYPSPAAGFGTGQPLDVAPGSAVLASFLQDAAGDDDRYAGASDDELAGVICAQDRVQASASASKHAAIAELIRRRPAPGAAVEGAAQMPEGWDEFTARELGAVLGVSAGDAEEMLALAWQLEVSLPGTKAAFRAGILSQDKAALIAHATALLDPAEARAAEAMVLDRAGSLTPATRAWPAGNSPRRRPRRRPAGHRLGQTTPQSRPGRFHGPTAGPRLPRHIARHRLPPPASTPDSTRTPGSGPAPGSGPDPAGPRTPAPAGPVAGVIPPGFAARVNMTVPAVTLTHLADRPGDLAGIGPVDPDPGANTSDCYRSQVPAGPARRAWRTSSVDALLTHMKAFRKARGTPGITGTRERMSSCQARGGGSA